MPGIEADDVAGHERLGGDRAQRPARTTDARDESNCSSASIARRARSSVRKPDERVDDEDGGNRGRFQTVVHQERHDAGGEEQNDDDARELAAENLERRNGRGSCQPVWAVTLEPDRGLVLGKARPARVHRGQNGIC